MVFEVGLGKVSQTKREFSMKMPSRIQARLRRMPAPDDRDNDDGDDNNDPTVHRANIQI